MLTDEVLAARLRKAAVSRGHALPGEDDAVTAALAEITWYPYPTVIRSPKRMDRAEADSDAPRPHLSLIGA